MKQKETQHGFLKVFGNNLFLQALLILSLTVFSRVHAAGTTNTAPETNHSLNFRINSPELDLPTVLKFRTYRSHPVEIFSTVRSNTTTVTQIKKPPEDEPPSPRQISRRQAGKKKGEEEKFFLTGQALFEQGLYTEALNAFARAVSTSPDSILADQSRLLSARIHLSNHETKNAYPMLDDIRELKSEASFYTIVLLTFDSQTNQALSAYQTMKQTIPHGTNHAKALYTVKEFMGGRGLASALFDDLDHYTKEKSVQPALPYLSYTRAWVYDHVRSTRNMKQAWTYYSQVADKWPDHPLGIPALKRAAYIKKNFLDIR